MTDEYRQKLLHWLTSMMLIILATAASMAAFWFFAMPGTGHGPNWRDLYHIGGLGAWLETYAWFFIPTAFWHLFDFPDRQESGSKVRRFFGNVATLHATLISLAITCPLSASELLLFTECSVPRVEGEYGELTAFCFDCCWERNPAWLDFALYAALILLVVLCIGKGAIAIKSRFTKAT